MAGLPPDGTWLIQQIDGIVILFDRYTEEEIVRFDPSDGNQAARAQGVIAHDSRLDDEQKCFAHFWSGYFYAHAGGTSDPIELPKPKPVSELAGEPYEVQVKALSRFPHIYRRVLRIEHFEDDDYEPEVEERRPAVPLEEAHVIGSLINGDAGVIGLPDYTGDHTVMVDIDVPVTVLPSSTPGHHHLYIDHPIAWPVYVSLLDALADAGIVERGYVEVSKERGETNLRLPWVKKGEERRIADREPVFTVPAPDAVQRAAKRALDTLSEEPF